MSSQFDKKDAYEKSIDSFCKKYEGKEVRQTKASGTYYIYNSIQAVLASRLKGEKIDVKQGSSTTSCRISNKSFDKKSDTIQLFEHYERNDSVYVGYTGPSWDDLVYAGRGASCHWGCVQINNEKATNIGEQHLTYDGICAYLALAREEDLLTNMGAISREITRSAREEMLSVNELQENAPKDIMSIANKYAELKFVARKVVEDAAQKRDEEETQEGYIEDLRADAADAFSKGMSMLDSIPLGDKNTANPSYVETDASSTPTDLVQE